MKKLILTNTYLLFIFILLACSDLRENETAQKKPTKKEVLQGIWEMKDEDGNIFGYMDFKEDKVDMAQMGYYSFKIEGDSIKFTNIERGVDFSEKITEISETKLILNNNGREEVYQKKLD